MNRSPRLRFVPRVDGLERRALLAARPTTALVSLAAAPSGRTTKRPAFSADYLGIERANLNLTSATAILRPGRTLTLSATVAAKIVKRPTGPGNSSFFVFGLDRGSSQSWALFPTRPGIRFDSVVVATITPQGIGGFVLDVARNNAQTDLRPAQIRVEGKAVKVTIPDGLPTPPPGSQPPARMRFAVWVRSKLEHTLADIDDYVASFLPENAMARVGVAHAKG